MKKLRRFGPLAALLAVAAGAAIAATVPQNNVGPKSRLQPSGRLLLPPGKLTTLGNHPGGGAVTTNGRFLWTLSAGRGKNDIRIVEAAPFCRDDDAQCRKTSLARSGRLVQVIRMPGVNGGIVMARDGKTAYVSGTPESDHKDQQTPAGTPGKGGDVIHVFKYDGRTGVATRAGTIPVPPPSSATTPQNFPPTNTEKLSWPRDLALSDDGRTLLAALNLGDAAAIIDTKTKQIRYVETGDYPYGAAITRNGRGLVSNEADGTVSVIDLQNATKLKDIKVGVHLSHPEGIAADRRADRAYVAVAGQDRVVVLDTKSMTVRRNLELRRGKGIGVEPTQVSVDGYGCYLTSADSGEDAVALWRLRNPCDLTRHKDGHVTVAGTQLADPRPLGRIPTASYPVMARPEPHLGRIVWIAAKGFGVGPNPNGPNPLSKDNSDDNINKFRYLPSIVTGTSGVVPFPGSRQQLDAYSAQVTRQLIPTNFKGAPSGSPLVAPTAPGGGRIKHVFYIVRENRTYDQILGDDARGNGAKNLELFPASVTPNAHALAKRFPLLDHVFANSEASIDGHFWTSASAVSDYVIKNWHQNYGGRKRPYDFGVFSITWPPKGFLFDQAEKQGIPYYNYGEAIAGTVPLTDKDRMPSETAEVDKKFAKSDLGPPVGCYPNDAYVGKNAITQNEAYDSSPPTGAPPNSESRFDCFNTRFTAQLLPGNSVPAFNYMTLLSDHTQGLSPGRRTPKAMVAENDYALGQIVQRISNSPIWDSSVIIVMEDDSQDGADHLDAHRIPAFVISPFARKGAVVHTRYDFPSLIRTAEIPIGMSPLNLFDALGVPMYDAFAATRVNSGPYTAIKPVQNMEQRNPNTPANRRAMKGLNLNHLDQIPQHELDKVLWWSVHGFGSKPPPPGPNASGKDTLDPDG